MNHILLVIFLLSELLLTILSVRQKTEKKIWGRNKFLLSAAQTLLFLLCCLLPGIDLGLRFKLLLVVLLLRTLLSGIWYLIRRGSVSKKNRFMICFSQFWSLVFLFIGFLPSFLFADYHGLEQTGPFSVTTAEAILSDPKRIEIFENDGSNREVPVHFYYPEDAKEGERYPLILFSHGAFGYYQSNTSTYMELASHGYVVAALDHPYHSFFCKDTAGKTITVNIPFFQSVMAVNSGELPESEIFTMTSEWVELRKEDISFVLDTLNAYNEGEAFHEEWFVETKEEEEQIAEALSHIDLQKIGLMGHSLGGAAAVTLGRTFPGIGAVIDLDGTMIGEELSLEPCDAFDFEGRTYTEKYVIDEEPYPVPLLSVDNEEHHYSRIEAENIDMPYANNTVLEHAVDGNEVWFEGSGHMNFTDLPLFAPALAKLLGTGSVDPQSCIREMNAMVLSFYDCKLKNIGTLEGKGTDGDSGSENIEGETGEASDRMS